LQEEADRWPLIYGRLNISGKIIKVTATKGKSTRQDSRGKMPTPHAKIRTCDWSHQLNVLAGIRQQKYNM
jgi:hypothetical protein